VTFRVDRPLTDYEQGLLDNIEEHDWSCTSVIDPEAEEPSFSYSIGLTSTLESPEFIVFGLPASLMHAMLSEIVRQLRDGLSVEDGSRVSGLLAGFDCVVRAVHPDNIVRDYLNSAIWYWNHTDHEGVPPVFQIVWPGAKDGLLPWDEGCSDIVREMQPPLWLPAAGHA